MVLSLGEPDEIWLNEGEPQTEGRWASHEKARNAVRGADLGAAQPMPPRKRGPGDLGDPDDKCLPVTEV